jgi:FeS assembly SUF system regulator
MIKIAKLTDYAVVLLARLSRLPQGTSLSAGSLAAQTGIPEPTVAKVLKKLARSKLVISLRGVAGGYQILRSSADMTICEVVEAMDGPIAVASCVDAASLACGSAGQCPSRGRWTPVNQAIRSALMAVTVADMSYGAPQRPKAIHIENRGSIDARVD